MSDFETALDMTLDYFGLSDVKDNFRNGKNLKETILEDHKKALTRHQESEWISVEDRLPTKEDGWIGHTTNSLGEEIHYIQALAVESGGYGRRVVIRQFRVLLIGEWTMDNSECEIGAGSFMDGEFADWTVVLWMPLPKIPVQKR